MTVVHLSEKGQIVVPKEIRDRRGYINGSAFVVQETVDGSIWLSRQPRAQAGPH
jgi:AbrB family looped-hinge helix DNA binding protein